MTKKVVSKRQCANCKTTYIWDENNHRQYDMLFHHTCKNCTQSCSYCRCEIGYCIESCFITAKECDICEKQPCLSCGITVFCEFCEVTCCMDCIEDEKEGVCDYIKEKKKFLDTKK